MEIKVGEYCRTKEGYIGKYLKDGLVHKTVVLQDDELIWTTLEKDIVKHSKNIIDLIEVGDILKLKDGEKWEVQEHQGAGNWIQTEWEVIENEENLKSKVDSIVTKEQFSSLEYII